MPKPPSPSAPPAPPSPSAPPAGLGHFGRALRHRDFRLYFGGQALSVLGSWVQSVAMSWLVYRLTGSAALLGLTAFLTHAPQLVVSPLAGVWIDRFNRRRMLIITQGLFITQSLILATLSVTGLIQPWHLLVLAALQGILSSFDTPLRQSLFVYLVSDRRDLQNAIALNGAIFNAGKFVGPPVAGLLLGLTSEWVCFLVNGLSFFGLLLAVVRMRTRSFPSSSSPAFSALQAGLRFAFGTPAARTVLLSLAALNATASSYVVLMPVFAKDIFAGNATTLGLLLGAAGGGALVATTYLATLSSLRESARAIRVGWLLAAGGLIGFAAVVRFEVALAMMFLLGSGITMVNVATNAVLQGLTPDALRGRVMSLFSASRFGLDAVGGLLAGLLANHVGAPRTLHVEIVLILVVLFALRPQLRRLQDQVGERS